VGAGPENVTVPRLIDKDPDKAEEELKAVGLVLGTNTTRETPDQNQVGKIIETNPEPGEKVAGGFKVDIVVGKKQTTIEIPDLQGKDLQEAANELAALGLDVNPNVTEEVDGPAPEGSLAETDPPAGTQVDPGSEIDLKASKGNQAEVPDLTGLSADQARQKLNQAGINNVDQDEQNVDDDSKDGKVVDQSSDAGDTVDPDDKFTFVIGNADG
jgi:serine/threonine-protein kinase